MILATIVKEVQLLLRDKGTLLSMFLLPVAFITFFGFVFRGAGGGDDDGVREPPCLAAWAAPDTPAARRVLDAVAESGAFTVELADDADAVRGRVARKEVRAGLVVPAGFAPLAGGAPAELCIDTAQAPQFLHPVRAAIQGAIGASLAGPFARREGGPLLVTRPPPGLRGARDPVDSFQVSVPGNAVLFIFFLSMGLAMSFIEEKNVGTWRRMLATPVSRSTLLIAKLVPFYVIGLAQMAFFFGIGILAFRMPVAGSPLALVLLTLAVVFCAVGLGLLLSAFGRNERQMAGFGTLIVLVLGLAGGCMVPRMVMPEAVKRAGLFTPHAWALDGYYDVLIREGTTVADVAPSLLALLGFGLAFALAGLLLFRFET